MAFDVYEVNASIMRVGGAAGAKRVKGVGSGVKAKGGDDTSEGLSQLAGR